MKNAVAMPESKMMYLLVFIMIKKENMRKKGLATAKTTELPLAFP